MNILAKRIKALREEKGLTQIQLAKILNIENTTLSQYENGQRTPSDEVKIKIADYFGVSLDYLLGRTDERNPLPDPDQMTDIEIEDLIRKSNINFDGAPLDDEDKQDVIDFVRFALKKLRKDKGK